MKHIEWKRMAVLLAAAVLLATVVFAVPVVTATQDPATDSAAFYKAKCFACHGAKAEKKFDSTLPEDQMVETVLKGKKVEKPPNMPGFEAKGVTPEQAKELVNFMKQLKDGPASN